MTTLVISAIVPESIVHTTEKKHAATHNMKLNVYPISICSSWYNVLSQASLHCTFLSLQTDVLTGPVEFWLTIFATDTGFLCLHTRTHWGLRCARVSQHALRKILDEMQKRMGSSALFTYQRGSDR